MKRVNYTHFQIQLIQTVLLADWKKNSIPAGAGGGGGGEGSWRPLYNSLYGEAPPKRGTFFRLQAYERVGCSLVEV